jgi:hypothetical protein
MRVALALIGIEEWTTGWRVVSLSTFILVKPFEPLEFMREPLVGRLTLAELLATLLFGAIALYALATLAVRRL